MDINDAVLVCNANLEWFNVHGITTKKITYKMATLRLIRNEFREIFVEVFFLHKFFTIIFLLDFTTTSSQIIF